MSLSPTGLLLLLYGLAMVAVVLFNTVGVGRFWWSWGLLSVALTAASAIHVSRAGIAVPNVGVVIIPSLWSMIGIAAATHGIALFFGETGGRGGIVVRGVLQVISAVGLGLVLGFGGFLLMVLLSR